MGSHETAFASVGLHDPVHHTDQTLVTCRCHILRDLVILLEGSNKGAVVERQPRPQMQCFQAKEGVVLCSAEKRIHKLKERKSEPRERWHSLG